MSQDTLQFILQVAAVFLGGGSVQLLAILIKRRAELRQLNTASDVNQAIAAEKQVTAADTLIRRLQDDGAVYRDQVTGLQTKVERLETRYEQAQRDFAAQLRDAHTEHTRLTTRIAQLQTDLDVSQRQIAELRRRL